MGYPRDLDEYTDEELAEEVTRRFDARKLGLCPYCMRMVGTDPCRYPNQHRSPTHREIREDQILNKANAKTKSGDMESDTGVQR